MFTYTVVYTRASHPGRYLRATVQAAHALEAFGMAPEGAHTVVGAFKGLV
jgi:hypothetical protein